MAKDFSRIDEHIAKQKKDFKPACDIEKKVQKQLKPLFEKFHPASSQFKLFEKYRKKMAEKYRKQKHLILFMVNLGNALMMGWQ